MNTTTTNKKSNHFSRASVLSAMAFVLATSSLAAHAEPQAESDTPTPATLKQPVGMVVPGYGPGVAGHVTLGPTLPVCVANMPCDKPYDGAIVQILNASRAIVGTAVTNTHGAFIVSLPAGDYITHIMTVDFPRCPEAKVTVGKKVFTLTSIACDTLIR